MSHSHSSSQSHSHVAPATRRRARVACSQCRQAKIRCSSDTIPCPRCLRLRYDCTIDPNYRRTNKRDEVKELQQQVQNLQSIIVNVPDVDAVTFPTSPVETFHSTTDSHPRNTAAPSAGAHQSASPSQVSPRTIELSHGSISEASSAAYTLGNMTLTNSHAHSMFVEYFTHYHGFLPILDTIRDEKVCFDDSPLLFWSVIAVSARQLRCEIDFLGELAPELNRLVWETVAAGTLLTLQHIQALLLLCSWPLPNFRLWNDKSIVLCNIALTSAMQIGMHRPGYEVEYSKNPLQLSHRLVAERFRTWMACVMLCQSLSLELGQGSSAHFNDWTIRNAHNHSVPPCDTIPAELRHALMIQRFNHEVALRWSNAVEGPHGLCSEDEYTEIIKQCEGLYDEFLPTLQSGVSLANRFELQNARLHVQCLYFLHDSPTDARRAGILRAYATASDMITTILADEECHDVLPYAPLRLTRMIFAAALLILRVLHSTLTAGLDYKRGQLLFNAAAFSLRQFSVMQNSKDKGLPVRASELLRAFWRTAERSPTMSANNITLRVKSRMGASLTYDCLLRFRDQHVLNSASSVESRTTANTSAFEPMSRAELLVQDDHDGDLSMAHPMPRVFSPTSNDFLNEAAEADMINMSWLEDIGYSGFTNLDSI